jgi:hypothetical protein
MRRVHLSDSALSLVRPGSWSTKPSFAHHDVWKCPFHERETFGYGDARRIDADEMDRLRRGAEEAEIARALAALEFLKERAVVSSSDEAIKQLRAAILAFQREYGRKLASSAF